jgi:hypothetical protein
VIRSIPGYILEYLLLYCMETENVNGNLYILVLIGSQVFSLYRYLNLVSKGLELTFVFLSAEQTNTTDRGY